MVTCGRSFTLVVTGTYDKLSLHYSPFYAMKCITSTCFNLIKISVTEIWERNERRYSRTWVQDGLSTVNRPKSEVLSPHTWKSFHFERVGGGGGESQVCKATDSSATHRVLFRNYLSDQCYQISSGSWPNCPFYIVISSLLLISVSLHDPANTQI